MVFLRRAHCSLTRFSLLHAACTVPLGSISTFALEMMLISEQFSVSRLIAAAVNADLSVNPVGLKSECKHFDSIFL